jgi:hypothetical protein
MATTLGQEGVERLLPAGAVAHLARLNRDYLDLVIAHPDGCLPAGSPLLAGLRAVTPGALDVMAACRYALFALEPQEIAGRAGASTRVNDPTAHHYGEAASEGAWPAFMLAALSFASQLSRHNPLSARLMLGFPAHAITTMAALDPWSLRQVAWNPGFPPPPRWHGNPCFWPDLLRAASGTDPLTLDLARLQGMQLLAADLHGPVVAAGRLS